MSLKILIFGAWQKLLPPKIFRQRRRHWMANYNTICNFVRKPVKRTTRKQKVKRCKSGEFFRKKVISGRNKPSADWQIPNFCDVSKCYSKGKDKQNGVKHVRIVYFQENSLIMCIHTSRTTATFWRKYLFSPKFILLPSWRKWKSDALKIGKTGANISAWNWFARQLEHASLV